MLHLLQARLFAGAAYDLAPSSPKTLELMGMVLLKDGYIHNVMYLLKELPTQDKNTIIQEECVSTLTTLVTAKCKAAGQLRDDFIAEIAGQKMTQESVDAFLDMPAAEMLSGLKFVRASDNSLTISELHTVKDPPSDSRGFPELALKLHHALTLTLPRYISMEATPAASLLTHGVAYNVHGQEVSQPKLVIVSWNMLASSSCYLKFQAPGFVAGKLENIAKVAEKEGASLIVLQECPISSMKTAEQLNSKYHGGSSTSFVSKWDYREARTGGEAAGFLWDPHVLQIVTDPVLFVQRTGITTSSRSKSTPNDTCVFTRPPVLSIFKASDHAREDNTARRLGLIVVVSVHLKCPSNTALDDKSNSPDLPRADVKLLGSHTVQKWIRDELRKAVTTERLQLSDPHCVLIIGDFNLAARYRPERDHGDFPCYAPKTRPSTAWDSLLDDHGYECLLRGCDMTNCGPPITNESYAYDNALVRFSNSLLNFPAAFVFDMTARRVAQWRLNHSEESDRFTRQERINFITAWSDHKPIVAHI